jgi:hypothetical protein
VTTYWPSGVAARTLLPANNVGVPVVPETVETAKLMVQNRVAVGKDYTATLPPEVQQEILDTAERELPPEYRDIVQKYYESLSEK